MVPEAPMNGSFNLVVKTAKPQSIPILLAPLRLSALALKTPLTFPFFLISPMLVLVGWKTQATLAAVSNTHGTAGGSAGGIARHTLGGHKKQWPESGLLHVLNGDNFTRHGSGGSPRFCVLFVAHRMGIDALHVLDCRQSKTCNASSRS